MIKKIICISTLISGIIPLCALAASGDTLATLIDLIISYLNKGLVLLMGVAVVIFVWNVVKYFVLSTEDHKAAAPYVLWSVVGFFVILSFWGLVNVLENTFGLQNSNNTPTSWSQFSNLFPGGSTVTTPTNNNIINASPSPTQTINNGSPSPTQNINNDSPSPTQTINFGSPSPATQAGEPNTNSAGMI